MILLFIFKKKHMQHKTLTFPVFLALLFTVLFVFSCTKDSPTTSSKPDSKSEETASATGTPPTKAARLANGDYTCGDFLSGTYPAGSGFYIYPDYTINVSSLSNGTLVKVNVDLVDVPNRFSIYDAGGSLIATTGWVGNANYPGPWGTSINATQTSFMLAFAKSGSGIYKLRVETSTSPLSDSWNAAIVCGNGYIPPTYCDPVVPCACGGGSFSGTYAGSGFYIYPDIVLNMQCAQIGHTVQIACSYLNVPNRFSVYDAAGNLVTTSGWVGNASYYGPWGSSLSTSFSPTLSFTRSSTSAYYILRVETVRNTTYESQNDAWNVSTSCL